jgi:diguanylate cyclase (GGDEF)-like protein/PAS domain S-box-containing protein
VDQSRLMEELSKINNELVTSRRELSRLSLEIEERKGFAERVIALSPDIVYVYDLIARRVEYSNRSIREGLGYAPEPGEATGDDFFARTIHPEDAGCFREQDARLAEAEDGEVLVTEFRARNAAGAWRWIRCRESVFARRQDGRPRSKLGIAEDVSAEKEREELLRQLSLVDELTGLKNRRCFEMLAEQHVKLSSRTLSEFVLIYLDLDRFKDINDNFGHAEGDLALKEAADLLRDGFRSSDIIARIGGDEFAVLLIDTDQTLADTFLARLIASTKSRNAARAKPYDLVFSAGMSTCEGAEPRALPQLLAAADKRMYQEKERHRTSANHGP